MAREKEAVEPADEKIKDEINLLENRLAALVGRLSIPSPHDNIQALDAEYHAVLAEIKRLRARSAKKY